MRILNVGDFNWMTGRERDTANADLFAIRSKLSSAAIRAGHLVVEFSDRATARTATPLRSRRLGRPAANRAFLRLVDEAQPDLLILNFADDLDNASLDEARRLVRGLVIVDVNIDPLPDPGNKARLARRRTAVDAVFATTAGPALAALAPPRGFASYMPNPVDRAVETGRAFDIPAAEVMADLVFPAGDDSARQIGGETLKPSDALARLRSGLPHLAIRTPGLAGPRLRGAAYLDLLAHSRAGWALSRFNDQPLYASDRMAHMMGSGVLTALDARAGFDRFYGPDEALFYNDLDDLVAKLARLGPDDDWRRETAQRGWARMWAVFDAARVFAYLLDQLFRDGGAADLEWPVRRWTA